jgi:hypothetical protein
MKKSDGGNVAIDDILPGLVLPVSVTGVGTAAALADATANPTLGALATYLMGFNGTTWDRVKTRSLGADGASATTTGPIITASHGFSFNGTTFDRVRGNENRTLLASAERTTTQTSADLVNYNAKGLHIVLDMTAVGTGSVTLTVQGKDEVSGKYYTILAGAAVITDVTMVYKVYPGAVVAANVSANDVLPRTFRVLVTANNANPATYSVGYSLII